MNQVFNQIDKAKKKENDVLTAGQCAQQHNQTQDVEIKQIVSKESPRSNKKHSELQHKSHSDAAQHPQADPGITINQEE
jgi:hypothetical protein